MSGIALARDTITAGIDVGGTKTAIVVTDASEQVHHSASVPTQHARLAEQLVELLIEARAAVGRPIGAVGVASPGHVDSDAGTVRLAVNLGQTKLAIGAAVESALGVPCQVEHDARAAAIWLYDQSVGDGRPVHGLAYLAIGTGIAAGVVIDGQPVAPPYKIEAIGDPRTMAQAVDFAGGFTDDVELVSGSLSVEESNNVEVATVRDPAAPEYAEPVTPQ